jgi:hypothetical protein
MMDSDTKFARIKALYETKNYISIPLEVRYMPLEYNKFGLFARAGIEFSLLNLDNKTNIEFRESIMESSEDEIIKQLGISTNTYYSTLYASAGLKYGSDDKPNLIFEIFLPSLFLSKDMFFLTETNSFEGFKFSIQIPVNKTK